MPVSEEIDCERNGMKDGRSPSGVAASHPFFALQYNILSSGSDEITRKNKRSIIIWLVLYTFCLKHYNILHHMAKIEKFCVFTPDGF